MSNLFRAIFVGAAIGGVIAIVIFAAAFLGMLYSGASKGSGKDD